MEFRWNEWNADHVAKHGVTPLQAEYVVQRARAPFPQEIGHGKFLVMGQDQNGMYLQVIYVADPDETAFVIHAMPLSDHNKKRYRRRFR
jgi:hypothetical protein